MMKNKIVEYLDELFPDPKPELKYNKDYELLIAVVLSAQTTDKKVNLVTEKLFKKYYNLNLLKDADVNDIIEIIKPIGTYNKKALYVKNIAKALLSCNGVVPNDRKFLESLDGVGRKTANVVLSNLYNENCIAVDTHVSRVSKRLKLANKNDDVLTIEKKLTKKFKNYNLCKLHHQLVLFGRYKCKALKPDCTDCKIKNICSYKTNI